MEETGKGFNALVIDENGQKYTEEIFDIGSEEGGPQKFNDFLQGLMENHMLLLAVFEDGQKDLMQESKDYLKGLGADNIDELEYRFGYIFAGVIGKTTGKDQMSTSDKTYIK